MDTIISIGTRARLKVKDIRVRRAYIPCSKVQFFKILAPTRPERTETGGPPKGAEIFYG